MFRASTGLRISGLLAFSCWFAPAQDGAGTPTKAKASDYPVHAAAGKLEIGAEYMIRSVTDGRNWYLTDDYLVVEVAIFPARDGNTVVNSNAFTLRVNGKKQELMAQAPGMVAASVKYPDWTTRPSLEAEGGVGPGTVVLGRRQPVERFPGDPRPRQGRLPAPPGVPQDTPGGVEREPAATAYEVVVSKALPEGNVRQPVSGFVYFAWRGKPKSIKSLELIYRGEGGAVTILRLV